MKNRAFTIMELVVVMCVMAILALVVLPKAQDIFEASRERAALVEIQELVRAIMGDVQSGVAGYFPHVGSMPSSLADLHTKPGSVDSFSPVSQRGWNGPYVDEDPDGSYGIFIDPWGTAYEYAHDDDAGNKGTVNYEPTITITSWGPDGVDDNGANDDVEISQSYLINRTV